MDRNIAIHMTNIKKQYQLGQIGGRTLQADLQSWWARKRGEEDPNMKIGFNQEIIGQKFMALDGIDLTIYQGETIGIIGSNGAGKSTLLKLLSRVTAPTDGEIDIYGRISSMLEVGTGFNAQMTGRENIYMNGAILGMTQEEINSKMEDIIEFSEVRDFIDTPVKRYSSGMFVKLAFSVAAHLNSEIMIMDEVLAVGDMAFQKKCLTKMREAAHVQGRTILYVSHNMNTIRELCDRCIVLNKGKIVYDGNVDEAIHLYMNQDVEENETHINLKKKTHPSFIINKDLTMNSLILIDKVIPVYDNQELLKMKINLSTIKQLNNIQFRMTLRTDSDQPVGTLWSSPVQLYKGNQTLVYEFPLDLLTKGNYYASIGFYQMNDSGQMLTLDHITHAFKITVTEKISMKNFNAFAYGNITFPQVKEKYLIQGEE